MCMIQKTEEKRGANNGLSDSNVAKYRPLPSPSALKEKMGMSDTARHTVEKGRESIKRVLRGEDSRILIIVGPCSTRNAEEHKDFSEKAKKLADDLKDIFIFVQRVYLEKPRTALGWGGCINGQENIEDGLRLARGLLLHNAEIGLPAATEFLDPIVPQYIADLVSWAAIGARTVESPPHRKMASGLSMPVGFKNNTHGNVDVAVKAVVVAREPQFFLGIDEKGTLSTVTTKGNKYTHVVLRGGDSGVNYGADSVKNALETLKKNGLNETLVIDCSHGNSEKDYKKQKPVLENVTQQIVDGNKGIVGVMLESNIYEGRQDANVNPKELKYGVSITDGCLSWKATEEALRDAAKMLAKVIRK